MRHDASKEHSVTLEAPEYYLIRLNKVSTKDFVSYTLSIEPIQELCVLMDLADGQVTFVVKEHNPELCVIS